MIATGETVGLAEWIIDGTHVLFQFMPFSSDSVIASGAADSRVHILDVVSGLVDRSFTDHYSRVKRLEVCQADPYLVWSAAEDGLIL